MSGRVMTSRGRCAVLAMALMLPACGQLVFPTDAGVPIEELDVEPEPGESELRPMPPTGPVVEVVRGLVAGESFTYTVFRSEDQVCTELFRGQEGSGGGCGSLPGEGLPEFDVFGTFQTSGGDGELTEVSGIVDFRAAEVLVETASGQQVQAVLVPLDAAEIDAQAFVVFIRVDASARVIVAVDGAGNVIERFDIGR